MFPIVLPSSIKKGSEQRKTSFSDGDVADDDTDNFNEQPIDREHETEAGRSHFPVRVNSFTARRSPWTVDGQYRRPMSSDAEVSPLHNVHSAVWHMNMMEDGEQQRQIVVPAALNPKDISSFASSDFESGRFQHPSESTPLLAKLDMTDKDFQIQKEYIVQVESILQFVVDLMKKILEDPKSVTWDVYEKDLQQHKLRAHTKTAQAITAEARLQALLNLSKETD